MREISAWMSFEQVAISREDIAMVKLESYWYSNRDWFHFEGMKRVINNDAPEEAKRNYQIYLKQLLNIDRRTQRHLVIPKNREGMDEYEDHDPDWDLGSFETESLIVFLIPYEEYCVLRHFLPIENYLHNNTRRMYNAEIELYLSILEKKGIDTPQIRAVLAEAMNYQTFVEFVEVHII